MKLDMLFELQPKPQPWSKPHPYGQREAEQIVYYEALEQVKLADKMGFGTVWCVEHHFREGRSACPSNESVLAAMSQITENIRIGFGVSLMPPGFQHPARVAEKVATVDILSRGRVEWGTGRSTPMEQIAFHVPSDDRSRAMWKEAVEFVVEAWKNETVSWDTDLIKFPERMQTPKPYQDPHPPCWLAAASETSARSAGLYGLGLLSFALFQPVSAMKATIDVYRAAQKEATTQLTGVKNDRVGVYTLVHCADDLEAAADYDLWESVTWWYRHNAEFTLKWEMPNLSPEEQEAVFPLLKPSIEGNIDVEKYTNEDMIIIGEPEVCLEKILRYAEAGVDQLLCYSQFGNLPHEKIMRNIELLGTKVIPELEKRGHRVDYSRLAG
jgi:alkanesulfonate monooxygenase SsuD/methylene tetrahydromethanopterin reductase-like flavin-dependent oxidoreductase (luciferase family)